MSLNHGINTYKSDTSFSTEKTASVGIPIFIGAWPCHMGGGFTGKPQLVTSYAEAKEAGGYSDEWRTVSGSPKWNLCQAMYAYFVLATMSPAIFCNVYDPSKHKTAVSEEEHNVTEHTVAITGDAIVDNAFVVKNGGTTLSKDEDFEVYYDNGECIIELLEDGAAYAADKLTIGYNAANVATITATDIEAAIEQVEECKALFGIVPDLICCPGWSQTPSVAAVMAAKAASINGLFRAKAVVDIDTDGSTGASTYDKVLTWKNKNGYTDQNMVVCWPLVKVGDRVYDMSVIACGTMASIDADNGGCPYESPSNKGIAVSGTCDKTGAEINLSIQQADVLSYSAGVVTAINFNGWVLWGNYTGCWPASGDVAEYFICTNRMMDFICNTFVNTYWAQLDRPLTRVRIDSIVNSFNAWLNGLTHEGKLYGGQIEYIADNNPSTGLVAGKFRLDTKAASPVPAQSIDMYVEFDVDYLTQALNS